jgi:hypothetical protein
MSIAAAGLSSFSTCISGSTRIGMGLGPPESSITSRESRAFTTPAIALVERSRGAATS